MRHSGRDRSPLAKSSSHSLTVASQPLLPLPFLSCRRFVQFKWYCSGLESVTLVPANGDDEDDDEEDEDDDNDDDDDEEDVDDDDDDDDVDDEEEDEDDSVLDNDDDDSKDPDPEDNDDLSNSSLPSNAAILQAEGFGFMKEERGFCDPAAKKHKKPLYVLIIKTLAWLFQRPMWLLATLEHTRVKSCVDSPSSRVWPG